MTKAHRGFTCVHPSGLSLACGYAFWIGAPLGLISQLHTPPLPATHVGVGTGIGHLPELKLTMLLLLVSERLRVAQRFLNSLVLSTNRPVFPMDRV